MNQKINLQQDAQATYQVDLQAVATDIMACLLTVTMSSTSAN